MRSTHPSLKILSGILLLGLSLAVVSSVHAAKITQFGDNLGLDWVRVYDKDWVRVYGSGGLTSVPRTTREGNNNVEPPRLENTLEIEVGFDSHEDIYYFEFQVMSLDRRDRETEYSVTSQVTNNSGIGFSAFKLSLGYRIDGNWQPSEFPDGLDFDEEPDPQTPPFSSTFTRSSIRAGFDPDELEYSGGILAQNATDTQEFRLDIPFLGYHIPWQAMTGSPPGYQFILRMEPTAVPVPPAIALLASALVAIGFNARQRAHSGTQL